MSHFNHKGRPGLVGGSLPKNNLSFLFQVLKGGKGSGNFGHAGRKGKKGGSSVTGGSLSQKDLFEKGDTSHKVMDVVSKEVASKWNVRREEIEALAQEESIDIKGLNDSSAKERLTSYYTRTWAGSGGGDAMTYAISSISTKLNKNNSLTDRAKDIKNYIDSKPLIKQALTSLGDAYYQNTQDYLKNKGIKELKLYRAGARGKDRPFTSWSLNLGGTRVETGFDVITEVVKAKDIFSLASTGLGTATESEVVVLPR